MNKFPTNSLQWFLDKLNAANGSKLSLSNVTISKPTELDPSVFTPKNSATNTLVSVSDHNHVVRVGYVRQPAAVALSGIPDMTLTNDESFGYTYEQKVLMWIERHTGHTLTGPHVTTKLEGFKLLVTYKDHYVLDGEVEIQCFQVPDMPLPEYFKVLETDELTRTSEFPDLSDSLSAVKKLFGTLNSQYIDPTFGYSAPTPVGDAPGRTTVRVSATDPLYWYSGQVDFMYNRLLLLDIVGPSVNIDPINSMSAFMAAYNSETFAKRLRDEFGVPCNPNDVTVTYGEPMAEYMSASFVVENYAITTPKEFSVYGLNYINI